MIDPLALVFIPGAAACIAIMAMPLFATARWVGLRRAAKRNRACCCGHCGSKFVSGEGDIFVAEGIFICEACARRARRRLAIVIPGVVGATVLLAGCAAIGFFFGGPELGWWLDSRWIPLLLPSVGLGLGAWARFRLVKRRNELANRVEDESRLPMPDLEVDALLAPAGVDLEPARLALELARRRERE